MYILVWSDNRQDYLTYANTNHGLEENDAYSVVYIKDS